MFPRCKLDESSIKAYLPSVTTEAVRASLEKGAPAFTDFVNLLSPAASGLLPEIRRKAAMLKAAHFGKTIRIYAPMYISNFCSNNCVYCAFRSGFKTQRKRLSLKEIEQEARIIKSKGIDSILMVSGEDQKISLKFLAEAVAKLKAMFSYVSIEIQPLSVEGYRELFKAGAHGVAVYQETYDRPLYDTLHRGPKKNYDFRLDAPARAAEAGFFNVGVGALLGLCDWRVEAVSLAAHAMWLRKKFWRTKVQFSFPRITPVEGEFKVPSPVSETELERMMLAFRIFFPENDLFISTRESFEFRKKVALTCASHMSAGSKVSPGGYSSETELGQFSVIDKSSVEFVSREVEKLGLETIFKDWDSCLGFENIPCHKGN